MTPNELARQLTRIASAIEQSKNPSRELVARDLKKILANLDPMMAEESHLFHEGEEMHEAIGKAEIGGLLAAAIAITGCSEMQARENSEATYKVLTANHISNADAITAGENLIEAVATEDMKDSMLGEFRTCISRLSAQGGNKDPIQMVADCVGAVMGGERISLRADGKVLKGPERGIFSPFVSYSIPWFDNIPTKFEDYGKAHGGSYVDEVMPDGTSKRVNQPLR